MVPGTVDLTRPPAGCSRFYMCAVNSGEAPCVRKSPPATCKALRGPPVILPSRVFAHHRCGASHLSAVPVIEAHAIF